jgi:hypothetical protein
MHSEYLRTASQLEQMEVRPSCRGMLLLSPMLSSNAVLAHENFVMLNNVLISLVQLGGLEPPTS